MSQITRGAMKDNLPLVSVVIPVFNGEMYLSAALDSVVAQDYRPLEIIVIDDGSTDATPDIVKNFSALSELSCHYLYQPNQGPGAARNRGLQLARGDFISFLDADDLWPPGRVEAHMQIFAQSPETELVIGTTLMSHLTPPPPCAALVPTPVPMIQHQLGSITCRRRVFDQIGYFDPTLRRAEDSDWFRRALRLGVVIHMTRTVAVEYRMREGSLTYGTLDHMHWFLAALRANLQARRRHDQAAVANDAAQGEEGISR